MRVFSEDKDLQLLLENDSKAIRKFGAQRFKILQKRVKLLLQADNLEELRFVAGHFHELIEDRKGQWACDLDQPYRLIFTPVERPIPTDANNRYIWIEIKAVELLEVVNYHGK